MNVLTFADLRERSSRRIRQLVRHFDFDRRASVFTNEATGQRAIPTIYVINLDRKPNRWRRLRRELNRFRTAEGQPLSSIARRFSAVDARYLETPVDGTLLLPTFTLADQLAVNPDPHLEIDAATRSLKIDMTRQEMAIVLSHVEIWRRIADGDGSCALILEDDVFMARGFARHLLDCWERLGNPDGSHAFDLLYLAFRDVGKVKPPVSTLGPTQRMHPGIWEASGYVLTRTGARKLLAALPVMGPVDLWLNTHFKHMRIFTPPSPLIEQRIDEPSTNTYSVLPVLSQVGIITREKALLPKVTPRVAPVIGIGSGSGLTSLGIALSMVGYTCVSDLQRLPHREQEVLVANRKGRVFNAYVNIGSIDAVAIARIARNHRRARFISTAAVPPPKGVPQERFLYLNSETKDKWAEICDFLSIEYPPFDYPAVSDLGQRESQGAGVCASARGAKHLRFDRSPWIAKGRDWTGIDLPSSSTEPIDVIDSSLVDRELDPAEWLLRDDTFPSNLALFVPSNFSANIGKPATLTLRSEKTSVRDFTSAAIASRSAFVYGLFGAEVRPSSAPGVITGVFLHRNGPRQEIDIEFRCRDTTKMLVNVYYNPGPPGTRIEYGYRGTPTEIDLGFDAAADFHRYEIEWRPNEIRWKVDDEVVHCRRSWSPTPIPDAPLNFNVNLWHCRSTEFAGTLDTKRLPTVTQVRSLRLGGA